MKLDSPIFTDAEAARLHLDARRWPNGPVCPHCGNVDASHMRLCRARRTVQAPTTAVSEAHLKRYLVEFDFRYNHRAALKISDAERTDAALACIGGKHLTYRRIGETRHA